MGVTLVSMATGLLDWLRSDDVQNKMTGNYFGNWIMPNRPIFLSEVNHLLLKALLNLKHGVNAFPTYFQKWFGA